MYSLKKLRARCTIWHSIETVGIAAGEILLSFDDGPNPIANTTARLLDVLQQEDVRGAFCVCGKSIPEEPELVHRIMSHGHLLVNHTYFHQPFAVFSERDLKKEIEACDAEIAGALNIPLFKTQFFRPACGWRTPGLDRLLPRLQKQLFPITDFGFDTNMSRHNYPKWVDRTLEAAKRDGGGLFVLHDRRLRFWGERFYDPTDKDSSAYRGWVPDAAALLIRRCRDEGFRFVDPHVFAGRMKKLERVS
ncbi:MAG: polysaccharide deacetylase family protein [Verrucomicrobia bacterium]|nr:polysaccharide deacetylase family protein [Verrucomicrobiota bacterium]MBV8275813.1 polysaccharide deacetylase family protein [Verrucomicrobiota bacterium]